ncbi:MAG: sigma-70 family RNA polymerase sigma factor [Cyanothece sp. SIO1E1]|nr:sigma-70 family RNA polymerase sigma factor [Cyanothece sp. SIO1E1]
MSFVKLSTDHLPSRQEVYSTLLRSLGRRKGFGIIFIQASPAEAARLITKIQEDLPQKNIDILQLTKPIDNLYDLVRDRTNLNELNVLIVQGLEKSLEPYIQSGYGGDGDYYNLDTVPRILSHLNQRRESFRDHFSHICFVFILPFFAIKYFIRRAPDFFDWSAGVFSFPTEADQLEKESRQFLLEGSYKEYCQLHPRERDQKILKIQELVKEPNQPSEIKENLFLEQGNLFTASNKYEDAISSYDLAINLNPDNYFAWHNRGYALDKLGRHQEALASYNKSLKIKPNFDLALHDRGDTLIEIGRDQDAIASYDRALFDDEFQILAAETSPEGVALQNFIARRLRQYRITEVDIDYILNEAYMRGCRMIESGKTIDNIAAWLRYTTFRIIQETARNQNKIRNLSEKLIGEGEFYVRSESLNAAEVAEQLEIIRIAMQQLGPMDQTIIRLRFFEGLSWQDIAQRLGEDGTVLSQATLRKRAQRALSRLRATFFEITANKST